MPRGKRQGRQRDPYPVMQFKQRKEGGTNNRALVLATRAQILRLYSKGRTPEQIANSLSMKVHQVENHLNKAIDAHVKTFAQPNPAHTFVKYCYFQSGIIDRLQHIYDIFIEDEDNKNYSAAVSALKTQSDIMDKIMAKGDHYGVIQQKKADKAIHLSKKQLKIELKKEVTVLTELLDQIDSHDTFKARREQFLEQKRQRLLKEGKPIDKLYRCVKVRKVKKDIYGFVTLLRNDEEWMFRQTVYDSNNNPIPEDKLTPQQKQSVYGKITTKKTPKDDPILDQDLELFNQYEQAKINQLNQPKQDTVITKQGEEYLIPPTNLNTP